MNPYELTSDRARVQLDVVHPALAASYWSPNIRRDVLEHAIANSIVAGAYLATNGAQVGFTRVVTDCATFAWLCDVWVHPEHRKRGIAKQMVTLLLGDPRLQTLRRWALATRDAHPLYVGLGFVPVPAERWMELKLPESGWAEGHD